MKLEKHEVDEVKENGRLVKNLIRKFNDCKGKKKQKTKIVKKKERKKEETIIENYKWYNVNLTLMSSLSRKYVSRII